MNRQRYMAELSKLLSFMFKEDRTEILQHYNDLLDNAEDENALLEEFGSPTKLAVTISRTYAREERKLSVNVESKDGSIEQPDFTRLSEGQTRAFEANAPKEKEPEKEITSASYIDIVEEIRREIAAENGVEYVPIFFKETEVEEAPVVEEIPAIEVISEIEEAPEVEEIPETEEAPEVEVIPETEDAPVVEVIPETEDAPEVEVIPETEDAPTVEEAPVEIAEEPEPTEESAPAGESEEEASQEPAAAEADEPEPAEELTESAVEEAEPTVKETVSEPEPVEYELPEELTSDKVEAETEARLSPALLILYLIFAIPIGFALLIELAAVTVAVLCGTAASVGVGVLLVNFAFSGITVAADMMLVLGGAIIAFAVGLLLLWTGIWLILAAFRSLVACIIKLGGRVCMKEAEQ